MPFYFAFDKLPISLYIYPVVGKKDLGKPPFKASERGRFGDLRESEGGAAGGLQKGKGTRALIGSTSSPEGVPNGLSRSV
jgi:hypothetical protein